jgi:hypothetical protein
MLDDSRQGENSRNYRSTSAFPAAYSGRPIRICEPAIFQLVLLAQRLRIAHILQRRSSVYRWIVGWVAGETFQDSTAQRSGWGRVERKKSTQASGIHLLEEPLRRPFKTGRRVPANPGTRRLPFFTSLPMERLSCP